MNEHPEPRLAPPSHAVGALRWSFIFRAERWQTNYHQKDAKCFFHGPFRNLTATRPAGTVKSCSGLARAAGVNCLKGVRFTFQYFHDLESWKPAVDGWFDLWRQPRFIS
jgi:hypothetical protein